MTVRVAIDRYRRLREDGRRHYRSACLRLAAYAVGRVTASEAGGAPAVVGAISSKGLRLRSGRWYADCTQNSGGCGECAGEAGDADDHVAHAVKEHP